MNPGGEEPPDVRQVVVIRNSLGLHARAAARLVTLVRTFDATVKVTKGEVEVAGDSIMGLMMLAAGPGTELELRASGRPGTRSGDRIGGVDRNPEVRRGMNGGPNPAPTAPDRVLTGLAAAPGIAAGPAHVMEAGTLRVAEYRIPAAKVEAERKRFADAVAASARQTRKLQKKAASLSGAGAEELGYLLEAGLQMLSDSRLIRGVDERIVASGINAEAAVQAEIRHISQAFAALPDPYLAGRVQDIRDVGVRLVRNLTHTPYRGFSDLPRNSIIIADEITPADTALMEPNRIAGFASALGGPESHTAIMARSLGLPAVLGIPGLTGMIQPGEQVILDGSSGQITLRPSAAALARYARQRHALRRERRLLARLRDLAAVTKDGVRVQLQANVELPIELETALRVGAEGIGLLRTEFLFMNRDDVPGEDEQAQALRAFVEAMEGKPVTIRTLDVGGDKLSGSLGEAAGGGVNPALGLRAIRLSLKVRSLMENQLAAILRGGRLWAGTDSLADGDDPR